MHSVPCRGVLKELEFFLLRTAQRDRPKGPSTANHQPPPTANRHKPPTAINRRHQPPIPNHQPPPTASHQPPTTNTWCACGLFWENCATENFFFPLRTALVPRQQHPCPSKAGCRFNFWSFTVASTAGGGGGRIAVCHLSGLNSIPPVTIFRVSSATRREHGGGWFPPCSPASTDQ